MKSAWSAKSRKAKGWEFGAVKLVPVTIWVCVSDVVDQAPIRRLKLSCKPMDHASRVPHLVVYSPGILHVVAIRYHRRRKPVDRSNSHVDRCRTRQQLRCLALLAPIRVSRALRSNPCIFGFTSAPGPLDDHISPHANHVPVEVVAATSIPQ